jgi:hypothetical protein
MMLNKKMLLVLAMAMLSFVAASPGSLRKLKDDKKDPEGSGITLKHFKGKKETDADEIELDLTIKKCKKGDDKKEDECADVLGGVEDAEQVSLATFTSMMADDLVDALESDNEDDRRELERRELGYTCYWKTVYWCDCCYCYYRTRWVCYYY